MQTNNEVKILYEIKQILQKNIHNMLHCLSWSLPYAECIRKMQSESQPVTCLGQHQCARIKCYQPHFSWLVSWRSWRQQSHQTKMVVQIFDTVRNWSQAAFSCKIMTMAILEPVSECDVGPLIYRVKTKDMTTFLSWWLSFIWDDQKASQCLATDLAWD